MKRFFMVALLLLLAACNRPEKAENSGADSVLPSVPEKEEETPMALLHSLGERIWVVDTTVKGITVFLPAIDWQTFISSQEGFLTIWSKSSEGETQTSFMASGYSGAEFWSADKTYVVTDGTDVMVGNDFILRVWFNSDTMRILFRPCYVCL